MRRLRGRGGGERWMRWRWGHQKYYLLVCHSETAHYKPAQQKKVHKTTPTHTYKHRQPITEEGTKQSAVAHRGTLDILKHTVRHTEAGRKRGKWNILAFCWPSAHETLYTPSPPRPQSASSPPSNTSVFPSLSSPLSHPIDFLNSPLPCCGFTPASSKFHSVILILANFYSWRCLFMTYVLRGR